MTCYDIVATLLAYQLQLINVLDLNEHADLDMDVSNEYSLITVNICLSHHQFANIRFALSDEAGKLAYIHCEDPSAEEGATSKIVLENWPGWRSPARVELPYAKEVLQSLQTADSIAAFTKHCTAGDNYAPGNFSKVSVNRRRIELRQINHMNSRSLNHKNNYSLRSLIFTIPFESNTVKKERMQTYRIGNMTVEFSDRSSENNSACGQRVMEELKRLAG